MPSHGRDMAWQILDYFHYKNTNNPVTRKFSNTKTQSLAIKRFLVFNFTESSEVALEMAV